MPIIKADWATKKVLSPKEKVDFIANTAQCVSEIIQVPDHVVNIMIQEIPVENVRFPAVVLNISWSQHENRNRDAKAQITRKITEKIREMAPEIEPGKIVIFFHDLEGENVGVAGQIKG